MEKSSESHRPEPYSRGEVQDEAHRRLREEVPALKEKKMKVAHGFHKVPQTGVICTRIYSIEREILLIFLPF